MTNNTIESLLTYANERLNDAIKNGTNEDIHYWRGYRDSAALRHDFKFMRGDDDERHDRELVLELVYAAVKENSNDNAV